MRPTLNPGAGRRRGGAQEEREREGEEAHTAQGEGYVGEVVVRRKSMMKE